MDANFEQAAEEFLQRLVREHYENGSGQKETIDIISIYERYGWLFERPAVEKALNWHDTKSRYFADFAVEGYLDSKVTKLSEKITNATTQATVDWQGEKVPYRRASLIIANEPDFGRRHELEAKVRDVTEDFNPDRAERMQELHNQSRDLDFSNYLDMCDRVKALHLEWLSVQLKELLARTQDVFESELTHFLGTLGVAREDATPADLSYVFRATQFDGLFPQEQLLSSLKTTLTGMGINLDAQPNVRLDTESRPLKSPRAFCAPVMVPEEVYLVISPKGGQDDYQALFHEAGHAEHFGFTSPDLPFAFKRLGDVSISESFAFLMESLTKNARWMAEVMGQHDTEDYRRLSRFHKLWMLRRYAAKLEYEMQLHTTDNLKAMRERYAEILGTTLGINISPANFLSDVDDGMYAAGYLRAWVFEVMLRKYLEDTHGKLWFASPEAGKVVIGLWRQGQQFPVDEMAHQIHYERLDIEPLILELAR